MEGFFYECRAISSEPIKVLEFVYRTYPAADSILHMHWRRGLEIVSCGIERSHRSEMWTLYCSMYPHMTDDTFIEFSEWYEDLKHPREKKSRDAILNDVETILTMNFMEET